jgi:hypothetical protein
MHATVVVLSYTPTLTALICASRKVPSVTGKVGAVVLVVQRETPGYEPLPRTVDEV